MKRIYFDHAATTPVKKEVLEKMLPYFSEIYGNANSQHMFGRDAVKAVDEARDTVARIINASRAKFISPRAARRRITGRSAARRTPSAKRENISSSAAWSTPR